MLAIKPVSVLAYYMGKERFAAFQYIVKCNVKVPGIPWICNITGLLCKIQKQGYFVPGILPKDPQHVLPVPLIHADNVIILVVIGALKLHCPVVSQRDAHLMQLSSRSVVDAAADLFGTGGGGIDVEAVGKGLLVYKILHNVLCHGTSADVAVADK